jgi:hypothetical protein
VVLNSLLRSVFFSNTTSFRFVLSFTVVLHLFASFCLFQWYSIFSFRSVFFGGPTSFRFVLSFTVVLYPDRRCGRSCLLLRRGRRALLRVAQTCPYKSAVFDEEGFPRTAGWIVTGALGLIHLALSFPSSTDWKRLGYAVSAPGSFHNLRVLTRMLFELIRRRRHSLSAFCWLAMISLRRTDPTFQFGFQV